MTALMSGQLPQNYVVHSVLIALAILIAVVLLLSHNWGCSPTGVNDIGVSQISN
jgi:hypothetical protein